MIKFPPWLFADFLIINFSFYFSFSSVSIALLVNCKILISAVLYHGVQHKFSSFSILGIINCYFQHWFLGLTISSLFSNFPAVETSTIFSVEGPECFILNTFRFNIEGLVFKGSKSRVRNGPLILWWKDNILAKVDS